MRLFINVPLLAGLARGSGLAANEANCVNIFEQRGENVLTNYRSNLLKAETVEGIKNALFTALGDLMTEYLKIHKSCNDPRLDEVDKKLHNQSIFVMDIIAWDLLALYIAFLGMSGRTDP